MSPFKVDYALQPYGHRAAPLAYISFFNIILPPFPPLAHSLKSIIAALLPRTFSPELMPPNLTGVNVLQRQRGLPYNLSPKFSLDLFIVLDDSLSEVFFFI